MNTIFENKEHYFNFRAAFAKAVNDPRAKKTVVRTSYGAERHPGWIHSEHFLLLNILRNKSVDKGFAFITNKNKLSNGAILNEGLYSATNRLSQYVERAKKGDAIPPMQKELLEKFLAPFDGTFTIEMLAKVEVPKISAIRSDFGKGKSFAQQLLEAQRPLGPEFEKILHDNLWELMA